MNLKFYVMIFTAILALGVLASALISRHIEKQIAQGVEKELNLQALQRQNDAVRADALLKEQVAKYNATQQERFENLSAKYAKVSRQSKDCESELKAIKELLGVFYGK